MPRPTTTSWKRSWKKSTASRVVEIVVAIFAFAFALACLLALELSRVTFVVVNLAYVSTHAYYLVRAVLTTDDDEDREINAHYSILSLVVLVANATLKYVSSS